MCQSGEVVHHPESCDTQESAEGRNMFVGLDNKDVLMKQRENHVGMTSRENRGLGCTSDGSVGLAHMKPWT